MASPNAANTYSLALVRIENGFAGEPVYVQRFFRRELGFAETAVVFDFDAFLGACPNSVRCCGDLEDIGVSGGGFGRFGWVGGVQAVASLAVDRLRPWASLSMLWARQTRAHSWATLSSPRIRN